MVRHCSSSGVCFQKLYHSYLLVFILKSAYLCPKCHKMKIFESVLCACEKFKKWKVTSQNLCYMLFSFMKWTNFASVTSKWSPSLVFSISQAQRISPLVTKVISCNEKVTHFKEVTNFFQFSFFSLNDNVLGI